MRPIAAKQSPTAVVGWGLNAPFLCVETWAEVLEGEDGLFFFLGFHPTFYFLACSGNEPPPPPCTTNQVKTNSRGRWISFPKNVRRYRCRRHILEPNLLKSYKTKSIQIHLLFRTRLFERWTILTFWASLKETQPSGVGWCFSNERLFLWSRCSGKKDSSNLGTHFQLRPAKVVTSQEWSTR